TVPSDSAASAAASPPPPGRSGTSAPPVPPPAAHPRCASCLALRAPGGDEPKPRRALHPGAHTGGGQDVRQLNIREPAPHAGDPILPGGAVEAEHPRADPEAPCGNV